MAHELETERLTLRQIEATDWQLFNELHEHQSVMEFVSDENSAALVRNKFEFRLLPWSGQSEQWLCLVILDKETGVPMGTAGFIGRESERAELELGFLLLPEYQGKGYAGESVSALITYAKSLGYEYLVARVIDGNNASKKLLERLGFGLREILSQEIQLRGQWFDDYIYHMQVV